MTVFVTPSPSHRQTSTRHTRWGGRRPKEDSAAEDLELYEAAKERVLSPDCARWLETGGKA